MPRTFVPLYFTFGAVVLVACGGTPNDRTASSEPATAAPAPVNAFDPAGARVGDTVVGLVIEDLRRERTPSGEWVGSARFVGSVTLAGRTFRHPDGADYPFPCFEADSATSGRLPRWKGDERRSWFCFENPEEASAKLGGPAPDRPGTIRIDRFTIHRNLTDATNSARLTEVGSATAGPVAAATRCFVTPESVLARKPNTVAPGPADLTGWIRLDPSPTPDSGGARLIDSDGRSLGATWRRLPPDSLLVVAFDDFLRVEMRLAVRDSSATGTATAHSDAALERDSAGRLGEFRRGWPVAARQAPCHAGPREASTSS